MRASLFFITVSPCVPSSPDVVKLNSFPASAKDLFPSDGAGVSSVW